MQNNRSTNTPLGSAPNEAFSIREAARLTGLSRSTLYTALKERRLVARKAGRRTLVLRADLVAFLADLPRVGGDAA